MNNRLYTEAFITKSLTVDDHWEQDENGNPMIIIEASNDNLDFDEEKVLQTALMNSKDYFLQNGVVSYDHKHIPSPDHFKEYPNYNEEQFILGHPVDAWLDPETNVVKVKAVLYPGVDRAAEIIKKLKSGAKSVKASVGGRRPVKEDRFDPQVMKVVPTITSVLWDEIALTYKPVNQTLGATILSPKEFVKSLTAGSSADPGAMTGGNALQAQSIEIEPVRATVIDFEDYIKDPETVRLMKMYKSGEISEKDVLDHIEDAGFTGNQSQKILSVVNKIPTGGKFMKKSQEELDALLDDLNKSLNGEDESIQKAKKTKKAKDEEYDEDMLEGEEEGEEEDEDLEKSLDIEDDLELQDVSDDIAMIHKSMGILRKENKELRKSISQIASAVKSNASLMKSIGNGTLATAQMVKSIGSMPLPRKTGNLAITDRFEKSQLEKLVKVDGGALIKSMTSNKVDLATQTSVNYAFRKGGMAAVAQNHPEIVEMLVGKE